MVTLKNKETFGDIFKQVAKGEEELNATKDRMLEGDSEELRSELHLAQASLRHALYLEELYWKQRLG